MIARSSASSAPEVSTEMAQAFAAMLPAIRRVAAHGLRRLPHSLQEELVADVIAKAYVAFVGLVAQGKIALAYPTVLAKFALKRIRDGRQVGCRQNVNDVLSPLAQRRRGFLMESLDERSSCGDWQELIDCRATPAEIVACRLDFSAWLGRLHRFKREVALRLAAGHTTNEAAQHFRVSQGRISQIRRELHESWNVFQGAPVAA